MPIAPFYYRGMGRTFSLLGPQGNGKSLMATYIVKTKGIDEGKRVITNTDFFFPEAKPGQVVKITLEDWKQHYQDMDFWNDSLVYFDEIQNWFHARESMTKKNRAFATGWVPALRRLNMDFIWSSQREDAVDLVLRHPTATKWKGVCQYFPEIPCKKCKGSGIYKGATCNKCLGFKDMETQLCSGGWSLVLFTQVQRRKKFFFQAWGPSYFGYYNTRQKFGIPIKTLDFDAAEVF